MATVMRNQAVRGYGEPISHGQQSKPAGRSGTGVLLQWALTHPGLTSLALSAMYIVTLGALVAVLSASALASPFGLVVGSLFVVEVLAYFAIAVYCLTPEHR